MTVNNVFEIKRFNNISDIIIKDDVILTQSKQHCVDYFQNIELLKNNISMYNDTNEQSLIDFSIINCSKLLYLTIDPLLGDISYNYHNYLTNDRDSILLSELFEYGKIVDYWINNQYLYLTYKTREETFIKVLDDNFDIVKTIKYLEHEEVPELNTFFQTKDSYVINLDKEINDYALSMKETDSNFKPQSVYTGDLKFTGKTEEGYDTYSLVVVRSFLNEIRYGKIKLYLKDNKVLSTTYGEVDKVETSFGFGYLASVSDTNIYFINHVGFETFVNSILINPKL